MYVYSDFCLEFSSSLNKDRHGLLRKKTFFKVSGSSRSGPFYTYDLFSQNSSEEQGLLNLSSPGDPQEKIHPGVLLTHFSPITVPPLLADHARVSCSQSLSREICPAGLKRNVLRDQTRVPLMSRKSPCLVLLTVRPQHSWLALPTRATVLSRPERWSSGIQTTTTPTPSA